MTFSSNQANDTADFGFKIEFARDTEDPGRVFRAFLTLIEFCQVTDRSFIKYLGVELDSPHIILNNIEQGSISVWLKNIFAALNDNEYDEDIVNRVNSYLIELKAILIKFIAEKITIEDDSDFVKLKQRIYDSMVKTGINQLEAYTPVNNKDLVSSIEKFQSATSELQESDKLYYLIARSPSIPVNLDFSISSESILVKETKEWTSERILKVKKPDYLGESKWEFREGRSPLDAKINDLEWLQKFKRREIYIAPGDAMKVELKTIAKYDYQDELVSQQHIIQKVIDITYQPPPKQLELPIDE